jgi:hypothetical protein
MMLGKDLLIECGVAIAAAFMGAWGFVQCFYPAKYKGLRDRLGLGYNPTSPLGQMIERFNRESGFFSRFSGLTLLMIAIVVLIWLLSGLPAPQK